MRSADRRLVLPPAFAGLALAATLVVSGCGTTSHGRNLEPVAAPDAAASAAQAASEPAATASAPARKPVSTAPIAPATQRAWDDALAAMHANRTADAERGFRAVVQLDPELAGPHANLGMLARQAGRLPEATTELERATELDPDQPVTWNQLAITYRQAGEFAKARAAYEHALALDPNYATAVLNFGVLCDLYLGDSAKALELYARYLALTPAGDPTVAKWVVDLKNRTRAAATAAAASAPPAASSAPAGAASTPAPAPAAGAKKEKP